MIACNTIDNGDFDDSENKKSTAAEDALRHQQKVLERMGDRFLRQYEKPFDPERPTHEDPLWQFVSDDTIPQKN